MKHIYFMARLCINLSNFKDISNIDILINLCLGTTPTPLVKKTLVKKMRPWAGENSPPQSCFKIRKQGSAILPNDGFPF